MSEDRETGHRSDRHASVFIKLRMLLRRAWGGAAAFFRRAALRIGALFSVKKADSASGETRRLDGVEAALARRGVRSEYASDETRTLDGVETALLKRGKTPAAQPARELPHISKEHLSGEGKEHMSMFRPRHRQPGLVISILLTSFRLTLVLLFMIGAAGFGALVGIAKAYMETTPTLDTAEIEEQAETSYIYDSSGELITMYTGSENRDWASLDEIPERLREAVIAIEDVRFYYHSGVDIKRLVGVFISNLMNNNIQGGSTITQQLVKNSLLSSERTYKRKIQEAYLSMQLEQEYDKDKILEAYLNTISLGGSNYGVKAAAMDYFHKDLSELSLRECAMLAGITQYPYKYNPRRCYYVVDDPSIINDRTDRVLEQMYIAGFITKQEYDSALSDTVYVFAESTVNQMYEMPYFVEYVVYDVITHLLEQRGKDDTDANRAAIETELRTQGYKIYTTVDTDVQKTVEQCLENWDDYPEMKNSEDAVVHYENDDGTISDTLQPQAAFVIIDQHTGQLKAVVGGRTTPEAKKTLNRAYQTRMPIGSSIKPIAVYAPAIDLGYSDGTVVPNLPLAIEGWENASGTGYPEGGSAYYGPVTLRTGLVQSLNSATAWTLMNLVGVDTSYNYLTYMGINPTHISKTPSGLALGDSGITPIELAGAYATIANSGVYLEPLSFTTVEDKEGNIILDADKIRDHREVFKETTAWIVSDMLVNAVQSGTGKRAQIEGVTVGGKTGTVQDSTGVLFAGITPDYTATLWIGSDKYKPLATDVAASTSAAPLWQYVMSSIYEAGEETNKYPNKGGAIIDATPTELGLVQVKVCSVSGLRATDACENDPGGHKPVMGWFVQGTEPTDYCDVHENVSICSTSGKFATEYCPTDTVSQRTILLLDEDSIYWKLTQAQRDKYLPGAFLKPSIPLKDITSDLPEYYDYFCNVHTPEWWSGQQLLQSAVDAANSQIVDSRGVLADTALSIPLEERQRLSDMIDDLLALIASDTATAGAVEQKTVDLKTLTNQLETLYSGTGP